MDTTALTIYESCISWPTERSVDLLSISVPLIELAWPSLLICLYRYIQPYEVMIDGQINERNSPDYLCIPAANRTICTILPPSGELQS